MKKVILISMLSLLSTSAFAISPAVLMAVLQSKEIRNVQDIKKVEVVATYRCMNCYDVEVTGKNLYGDAYVKVRTEQVGSELTIRHVYASK